MNRAGDDLARLFGAARRDNAPAVPVEMPFGFDTRVLAMARSGGALEMNGSAIRHLLYQVAIIAAVLLLAGSAGTLWQLDRNRDLAESFSGAYVIADRAIDSALSE